MRPGRDLDQPAEGLVLARPGGRVQGGRPLGRRQHPARQRVATLERGGAAGAGHLAGPEQVLQGVLDQRPVPAPLLALAGAGRARGRPRPRGWSADRVGPPRRARRRPARGARGRPRACRPRRRERRGASGSRGAARSTGGTSDASCAQYSTTRRGATSRARSSRRTVVGAEPGEERQVLAAHDDVDAVDLHDADRVDDPLQVAGAGQQGARPREALGRERDAPGAARVERCTPTRRVTHPSGAGAAGVRRPQPRPASAGGASRGCCGRGS